jgi:TPP-dependent pyruvate/acetoin dehydrogenase alpha subunit
MGAIDRQQLLEFYEEMLRIRFFEEKIRDVLHPQGLLRGSSHLCIGQEAVAVGAMHALQQDDYVLSTHRGHGHALAKGMEPYVMFAEILGRKSGCCQGKGGSMHLAESSLNFVGQAPVVGSNAPMGAGLALAARLEGSSRLAATFFGEGALNTGAFQEAANIAALWRLPVIFLCENNLYAISVPLDKSSAVTRLESRLCCYGIEGRRVNGMDVVEVYEAVQQATEQMRTEPFPAYLVFDTYRFQGHHTADKESYRPTEEAIAEFRERDPIHILEYKMIDDHTVDIDTTIEYRDRIRDEIDRAFKEAVAAPWPEPHEALNGVYAQKEAE